MQQLLSRSKRTGISARQDTLSPHLQHAGPQHPDQSGWCPTARSTTRPPRVTPRSKPPRGTPTLMGSRSQKRCRPGTWLPGHLQLHRQSRTAAVPLSGRSRVPSTVHTRVRLCTAKFYRTGPAQASPHTSSDPAWPRQTPRDAV
ncbi:hypothetical protein NDU88_004532 [Pleurodeles waltl]|uniref:Uncharacterized protein n=1 Tax=Pleurodeles waltl TaxID=8319 RepID=A0AAV7LIW3_PLEWA|nr:hypothetical protein NDU88_004532 [Pleurodeles waltl]